MGISLENVSRYLSGRVLPTTARKRDIVDFVLSKEGLTIASLIDGHVEVNRDALRATTVDNTHLLNDARVLDAIAFMTARTVLHRFSFSKVATVEVDGLPFAKALAAVSDLDYVYARRKRPVLIDDVLSEDAWPGSGGRLESIYLPRRFIRPDEKTVIVDDVIRTGATLRALIRLLRSAGAEPQAAVTMIGVGEWETGHKIEGIPLFVLRRYT